MKKYFPWIFLSILFLAFYFHAHIYHRFISDDALISLRYAQRLVGGHGLTWTDGERVEGYTDFLWVILSAVGGIFSFDYIIFAKILDHLGALGALFILGCSPQAGQLKLSRLLLAGSLFVASIPVAVWAQGGLEHGFMLLPLAGALYLIQRKYIHSVDPTKIEKIILSLCLSSLILLRADGLILVAFGLFGALLTMNGRLDKRVLTVLYDAVAPAGVWGAQLLFRLLYYGQWMPNTATAKLSFNSARLALGFHHVVDGFSAMSVLLGAALISALMLYRYEKRKVVLLMVAVLCGWTAYVWSVGGDIFPGWRQLLFLFVPLSFLVAEFSEVLIDETKNLSPIILIVLAILLVPLHVYIQRQDSENRRAKNELWEWDAFSIGPLLKKAFGEKQPLHAVDAAGALPYMTEFPSLDMLGLNDAYIAHHPPANFGYGPIGHELGDGGYVFQRRPDLISFNNAGGARQPNFLSGRQLLTMPEFHREYQSVRFLGIIPTGTETTEAHQAMADIWIRREGGKLGLERASLEIKVPGYFLTGSESDAYATLNSQGDLVARLSTYAPGVLPALDLPLGKWRIKFSPLLPHDRLLDIRCETSIGKRSAERNVQTTSDLVVQIDQGMKAGLALAPDLKSGSVLDVKSISFIKADVDAVADYHCREGVLKLALEDVRQEKPSNLFWSHPGNIVMNREGLVVEIKENQKVSSLRLTLDHNDSYSVAIKSHGKALWQDTVGPINGSAGLAAYTMTLPKEILLKAGDEIRIVPQQGDGAFSLGSLVLY